MDENQDTGWRDEPESPKKDTSKRGFNWWPLLLLPIAFLIGWGGSSALEERNQRLADDTTQYGVGAGAPIIIPCDTPSPSPETTID